MPTKQTQRHRPPAPLAERARRTITLLIACQLGTAVGLAGVLALTVGGQAAYSALVGGLIGAIPNYYFASRLRRRRAAPVESLRQIYVGEFIKIAFTAALFVIAIRLLAVDFLIVVLTYVAMVAVNWLALLVADLGELPRPAHRGQRHMPAHGEH